MRSIWWRQRGAWVLGILLSSCTDIAGFDGNPQMNPGQECLACHIQGGQASSLAFSVGGTVYPEALAGAEGGLFDAQLDITDLNGLHWTLHSNGAGNFYSAEAIAFPATVSVAVGEQTFPMIHEAPNGQCNACHQLLTNSDGTVQPAPPSQFALDAGLAFDSPGRIYGFARTACPSPISDACPNPRPSYAKQVSALIQANCLPCHQRGQNLEVLDNYADIVAIPDNKVLVAGCMMPILDFPSEPWFQMSPDARALVIDWLNCGAPNN